MPNPKRAEDRPVAGAARSKKRKWVVVFGTLGIASIAGLFWARGRQDADEEANTATAATPALASRPASSSAVNVQPDPTQEALMKLFRQLGSGLSPDDVRAALVEMEAILLRAPRDEAVR